MISTPKRGRTSSLPAAPKIGSPQPDTKHKNLQSDKEDEKKEGKEDIEDNKQLTESNEEWFAEEKQCCIYFDAKEWSPRFPNFSIFTIEMPTVKVVNKAHAEFTINIKCVRETWSVSRRFSEFVSLKEDMIAEGFNSSELPSLPPKTWLTCLEMDFLNKRRELLHIFVVRLLQIKGVCEGSKAARNFFDLDFKIDKDEEEALESDHSESDTDDSRRLS